MSYKIIVAHPGKQHSFRLATAVEKKGLLDAYITTVYDKNTFLMRIIKRIIGQENAIRASTRKCADLENNKVIQFCELRSLITLLLVRIDRTKKLYWSWNLYVAKVFGRKVAKYAIKHKADMVITYDSNAAECFEFLIKHAPHIKRVMDVSHANRLYEKALFEEDMKLFPEWANSIRHENSYLWDTSLDWVAKENKFTQFFLVPSEYVKKTLCMYGVKNEQVFITPYGVDTNKFFYTSKKNGIDNKELFFLYVGNATEMKGFGHLLRALELVNAKYPGISLHYVGGILDPEINRKYGNHIVSHGYLQFSEMAEIYKQADVMVFPSLSEGMTLSGIEALCSGVPLICTENSGVNDLIRNGENGFVVEVSNSLQLAEKMIWFIENREALPLMKKRANETGMMYSWETYYTTIGDTILKICQGV